MTFGDRKWFLSTNLFLIKTFLITKFECTSKILFSCRCFFWICWNIVTPIILLVLKALTWYYSVSVKYDNYEFPRRIQYMGYFMEFFPLVIVLLYLMIKIRQQYKQNFKWSEILKNLKTPTEEWSKIQASRPVANIVLQNQGNCVSISMTSLLMHTVAHSNRSSCIDPKK